MFDFSDLEEMIPSSETQYEDGKIRGRAEENPCQKIDWLSYPHPSQDIVISNKNKTFFGSKPFMVGMPCIKLN